MTKIADELESNNIDGAHRMLTGITGECAISAYLIFLRCDAASAAAVAQAEVITTYDAATVLVTVTSQVALLPSCHGIDVNPSGRFPSDLVNPCDGWNVSPG